MIATLLCAIAAQSGFASVNRCPMPPSKSDFWFVALGDNRPAGPGLPPTHAFREILNEVGTIGPEFIISSGDLLYGNEDTLEQYKQEIKWMKPLIQTLPCPFFNAPGNHEINNDPDFLKAYTAGVGPLYGSFDFGGIRFVCVCTEVPAPETTVFGAQLDWIKRTLDGKQPAVIFQHHPIFVRGTNTEKESAAVSNHAELHDIYLKGGVKMVLEGHDHIYNAQVHDGIDYRIAGGAGAPLDGGPEEGGYFHFLLVHAHDGKLDPMPIPAETLEVVPLADGVSEISDYAYADFPVTNLRITSTFKPRAAIAFTTNKKRQAKAVDVTIIETHRAGKYYESRLALSLPHAHGVTVSLQR